MIHNWRYDDGKWDARHLTKPSWRCTAHIKNPSIEDWFESQHVNRYKDYEIDFRFNSGDPCYYISIYKEELATAFLLRWKNED